MDPQAAWTLYTARWRRGMLAILFLVATTYAADRYVLSVLLEPIKREFRVSDTLLGLLGGFSFALFYVLFGMPMARWADRGNRRTVVTVALAVWSVMTIACGLAHSFWQLVLARVGVGAGESGAIPPAMSLIADYFPPQRRASALAIFTSAATVGTLIGIGLGGYLGATVGWRGALLIFGIPGIALAVLTQRGLAEPRLKLGFGVYENDPETTRESLGRLRMKSSYVYALLGLILYYFVAYGTILFFPTYLIRTLHVPLMKVSIAYGATSAAATFVGTLGGGWLADRLARASVSWHVWLPAAACALCGPLYLVALSGSFREFLLLSSLATALLVAGLPAVFAAIHAVCGGARRALATAIVLFSGTLLGGGFGPLLTGALSDAFQPHYGSASLRPALMIPLSLLIPAAVMFFLAGRAMPRDLED